MTEQTKYKMVPVSALDELSEYSTQRHMESTGDWRAAAEDIQERIDELAAAPDASPCEGDIGALRHAAIEGYRALNACAMFMAYVEGENAEENEQINNLVERAGGALILLEKAINPESPPSPIGEQT